MILNRTSFLCPWTEVFDVEYYGEDDDIYADGFGYGDLQTVNVRPWQNSNVCQGRIHIVRQVVE